MNNAQTRAAHLAVLPGGRSAGRSFSLADVDPLVGLWPEYQHAVAEYFRISDMGWDEFSRLNPDYDSLPHAEQLARHGARLAQKWHIDRLADEAMARRQALEERLAAAVPVTLAGALVQAEFLCGMGGAVCKTRQRTCNSLRAGLRRMV